LVEFVDAGLTVETTTFFVVVSELGASVGAGGTFDVVF
jgi:hypothetical protein